jgi:hypothetical protein
MSMFEAISKALDGIEELSALSATDRSILAETIEVYIKRDRGALLTPAALKKLFNVARGPLEWDLRGDEEDDKEQEKALKAFEEIEKYVRAI